MTGSHLNSSSLTPEGALVTAVYTEFQELQVGGKVKSIHSQNHEVDRARLQLAGFFLSQDGGGPGHHAFLPRHPLPLGDRSSSPQHCWA